MNTDKFKRNVELNYVLLWGTRAYEAKEIGSGVNYKGYHHCTNGTIPASMKGINAYTNARNAVRSPLRLNFVSALYDELLGGFGAFRRTLYVVTQADIQSPEHFERAILNIPAARILYFGDVNFDLRCKEGFLESCLAKIPQHIQAINLFNCIPDSIRHNPKEIIKLLSRIPYHVRSVSLSGIWTHHEITAVQLAEIVGNLPWHIRHLDLDLFSNIDFLRNQKQYCKALKKINPEAPAGLKPIPAPKGRQAPRTSSRSKRGITPEKAANAVAAINEVQAKAAAKAEGIALAKALKAAPKPAPAKFRQLFPESAATPEELLAGAKALLQSYVMDTGSGWGGFKRFFSLHWGRRHVEPVTRILNSVDIGTVQQLMAALTAIPLKNRKNGSLVRRIQYIETRMWAVEPDWVDSLEVELKKPQVGSSYLTMLSGSPSASSSAPSLARGVELLTFSESDDDHDNDKLLTGSQIDHWVAQDEELKGMMKSHEEARGQSFVSPGDQIVCDDGDDFYSQQKTRTRSEPQGGSNWFDTVRSAANQPQSESKGCWFL